MLPFPVGRVVGLRVWEGVGGEVSSVLLDEAEGAGGRLSTKISLNDPLIRPAHGFIQKSRFFLLIDWYIEFVREKFKSHL